MASVPEITSNKKKELNGFFCANSDIDANVFTTWKLVGFGDRVINVSCFLSNWKNQNLTRALTVVWSITTLSHGLSRAPVM